MRILQHLLAGLEAASAAEAAAIQSNEEVPF
jgi:hypothetical protein